MNLRTSYASLALALLIASSFPCSADILIVNPDASGDYPTIKAAIEAAVEGDTIRLGEGTFTGSGNRNLDFGGKNLVLTSAGGSASTIVDLGGGFQGSSTVRRFLTLQNGETSAAVVAGITIRNCVFQEDGGAFLINGASPLIRDIVFNAIQSESYYLHFPIQEIRGGAIFVHAGAPTISDCVFKDFHMPNGRGGAIYADGAGPIVVEGCTFLNNAVLRYVVSLTNGQVVDCLFEENDGAFYPFNAPAGEHQRHSEARGDAWIGLSPLGAFGGPVEVRSCTFIENQALDGGGMTALGSVRVEDCHFFGNWGDIGGALEAGGGAILNDCVFSHNYAYAAGTVNWVSYSGSPAGEMNRCLVLNSFEGDNGAVSIHAWPTARPGGGTYEPGQVRISDCTIYGSQNGGLSGSFFVERTIIAFTTYGPAILCGEGVPSLKCCDLYGNAEGDWTYCIFDDFGQNGNISADPLFCNAAAENFTLSSNSPCAPANSNGCELIGAYDVGCDARINVGADPRMEATSWGRIKGMYR